MTLPAAGIWLRSNPSIGGGPGRIDGLQAPIKTHHRRQEKGERATAQGVSPDGTYLVVLPGHLTARRLGTLTYWIRQTAHSATC